MVYVKLYSNQLTLEKSWSMQQYCSVADDLKLPGIIYHSSIEFILKKNNLLVTMMNVIIKIFTDHYDISLVLAEFGYKTANTEDDREATNDFSSSFISSTTRLTTDTYKSTSITKLYTNNTIAITSDITTELNNRWYLQKYQWNNLFHSHYICDSFLLFSVNIIKTSMSSFNIVF